jgi:amino acid transporter
LKISGWSLCHRNLNYWDSVSTLAGEVADPARTFPRAMAGGVTLVISMYLLPLLVGLGVTTDTEAWTLGYFSKVADQVAGKWLVVLMVIAAAVSQLGQYQAEMSSDSYQLLVGLRASIIATKLPSAKLHLHSPWATFKSEIVVNYL